MRLICLLLISVNYVTTFLYCDLTFFFVPFTNWTLLMTTFSLLMSMFASSSKQIYGKNSLRKKCPIQKTSYKKLKDLEHPLSAEQRVDKCPKSICEMVGVVLQGKMFECYEVKFMIQAFHHTVHTLALVMNPVVVVVYWSILHSG